jgi:hypothetical protein
MAPPATVLKTPAGTPAVHGWSHNAVVPPQVRAHLAARQLDGDDVLRTLMVPLLVTRGRLGCVALQAMAEHVHADLVRRAGLPTPELVDPRKDGPCGRSAVSRLSECCRS